jgi:TRAP transporter 4TM/12TM fusion protein
MDSHSASKAHEDGAVSTLLKVGSAAYALFHLYTSLFGTLDPLVQRGVFIGGGVGFIFLAAAARRPAGLSWPVLRDLGLALIGLYGGLHVAIHTERLMDVMNDLTMFDMVLAFVTLFVVLEASRRTIGVSLPIMALVALAFYLWGNGIVSGDWQPPRISMQTAMSTLYGSTNGMFGFMADIGTRVIAIYVIFGSLLMAVGAGDVFMKAAALVAGRTYGGPAKMAVVTSALFGTVSGSAVANVMSVGSVTIPTMVRAGYRKDFAAGIEASASAGGQIMPPVMGAGAFIMAELLNIPYASVAAAAAIPALLYFGAIYFSIDCYARAAQLKPMPRGDVPSVRDVFLGRDSLPAFGPLAILAWLLFDGYSPTLAGAIATVALVAFAAIVRAVSCLRGGRSHELGREALAFGRLVWGGLIEGGKGVVVIAALLAAAGILVTVLTATGIAVKFSQLLLGLSGEQILTVLILSAVLCILLGMDVPTTASYILTASVAGPLLVRLGLDALTGHLFIFYFAILSAITPPVCASVFAAATIVQENFWKVAGQALRIAGAVYFIPFLFVYRPELLLYGSAPEILYNLVVALVAVAGISGASIGYLLGPLGWPGRLYLYAASALLFYPSVFADAAGIVLVLAFVGWRAVINRTIGKQTSTTRP